MIHPAHKWFPDARYGLFLHWGPYAQYARGEQVLIREMIDQRDYARRACTWNPERFDAAAWAREAVAGGFRYAVLTTRHHDGYCLWDTATTDYSCARQAPRRDFVREFVEAFRTAGLRIGLYYSWNDLRIPALFAGPQTDPAGWAALRRYVHTQVEELLTGYGKIDQFWFDGTWPRNAVEWDSPGLVARMRQLQPHLMINNRLGEMPDEQRIGQAEAASNDDEFGIHEVVDCGDFGTPEHHITAEYRPLHLRRSRPGRLGLPWQPACPDTQPRSDPRSRRLSGTPEPDPADRPQPDRSTLLPLSEPFVSPGR
ncbi:MAG: alpha-L-fucosidase [Opitutaceae bacterium]